MELYLLDESYMDLEYIDHCYSFFLWFYYQLLLRSLNRLWFDCLFTRCTDQSIASKEELTTIYYIYLSIFYLIIGEFACFEDDSWNAWFTSILLPYSSIIIIVLFYLWLLGFELRNTGISHTDLFQHEYLQAEITFRYYLNIVSN